MPRHLCTTTCVLAVSLAAFATGCADDTLPQQPEIPPSASMTADLTGLEAAPVAAKQASPTAESTFAHFANAWVRVKVVQLYAAGVVAIPALVMGAALGQEPTSDGDQWVWDVSAGAASASLRFSGNVVSGWDVDLLVTNAEVTDYLWVEGSSNTAATEGAWVLHDAKEPAGEDKVLDISWSYTSETDHSLTYRNVNQSSADVNDEVEYSLDGTTATVVLRDATDSSLVATARWSTETGAGSIQVPNYNNGELACWGANFQNADCP